MAKMDDADRFRHMLEHAWKVQRLSAGRTRADLDRDELFALAMTRALEAMGEAAAHVTEEGRACRPSLGARLPLGDLEALHEGHPGFLADGVQAFGEVAGRGVEPEGAKGMSSSVAHRDTYVRGEGSLTGAGGFGELAACDRIVFVMGCRS